MMLSFARHVAIFRWPPLLLCLGLLLVGCQTLSGTEGLTEEQINVLREIGFHEEGDNWGFDLDGRILFDLNAAELSEQNRKVIARMVKSLKTIGITRLIVEGHSDITGDKLYNEWLSLRRARAVAREISRNGLSYGNITVKGYGVANPIGDNATREGRAQNRRVVIIVPVE
ncbi:MAG: OmpA family protein [Azoarcus sp.]|jgi:outer membrane protein OmpA-like peptidoglycan-associated protein|nr:OmpA family protein [Azoarcus sp.]